MPMTVRQLNEATADYDIFLDGDEIVGVEDAKPGINSTCDICGRRFLEEVRSESSTGSVYINYLERKAKQLVVVPIEWLQGSAPVRHYRLLVCRQGVSCRKRRLGALEHG